MDKPTDRSGLLRNNISSSVQTLTETTVLNGDTAEMRGRHAFTTPPLQSQKSINYFDKVVRHNDENARLCVHVNYNERIFTENERSFVRALLSEGYYKHAMTARPIDRIAAAIHLSGKSFRGISEDAKLGVNYISQMLSKEIAPKNEILIAICRTLDIDAGWALTGKPSNHRIDTLLQLFDGLPFDTKREAFTILSKGDSLSIEELRHVSNATGTTVEQLQDWLATERAPEKVSVEQTAFDELNSIANGHELEFELLKEALAEAYDIEREIYGQLGPSSARARLVKEIYALKLANREASRG